MNLGQQGPEIGATLGIQRQWLSPQHRAWPRALRLPSPVMAPELLPTVSFLPTLPDGPALPGGVHAIEAGAGPAGLCPSPTSPVLCVFLVGSLVPRICKAWLTSPHTLEACPPGLLPWQLERDPSKPCSLASVQGCV